MVMARATATAIVIELALARVKVKMIASLDALTGDVVEGTNSKPVDSTTKRYESIPIP